MTPRGVANLDPRVTIGRNYKGAYLTLLHTKYKSSGPHGFREDFFFAFFPIISLWRPMTPRGVANLDPRGMIAGFMKATTRRCYILNIYFREEDFFIFSHYKPMLDNDAPGAWPIWAPGTRLPGFMKGVTKH